MRTAGSLLCTILAMLSNRGGEIVRRVKQSAYYLNRFKFRARTIFDIGVNQGTPNLYQAFRDRTLVLIDPLEECQTVADRLRASGLTVEFHARALGRSDGRATLKVVPSRLGLTTLLRRTVLTDTLDPGVSRSAQVTTLDALVDSGDYAPPFGLKVDTEGYELEVLAGAVRTLTHTEFLIMEASVKARFESSYQFSELIAAAATHGFELLDVLNGSVRGPRFLDSLFVKRDDYRRMRDMKDY